MTTRRTIHALLAIAAACGGASRGAGAVVTPSAQALDESPDSELARTTFADALTVVLPAMTRLGPGVLARDLEVGTGALARPGREVRVTYLAYLADGTEVDRSGPGDAPLRFTIGEGKVIRGWDLGVRGMKLGGTRQLVVASRHAYGRRPMGRVPANAVMVFVVRLEEVR